MLTLVCFWVIYLPKDYWCLHSVPRSEKRASSSKVVHLHLPASSHDWRFPWVQRPPVQMVWKCALSSSAMKVLMDWWLCNFYSSWCKSAYFLIIKLCIFELKSLTRFVFTICVFRMLSCCENIHFVLKNDICCWTFLSVYLARIDEHTKISIETHLYICVISCPGTAVLLPQYHDSGISDTFAWLSSKMRQQRSTPTSL